jgi:hypothetical protein
MKLLKSIKFAESFWRGIFYAKDVGNLETFDVRRVPEAIPNMVVEMK